MDKNTDNIPLQLAELAQRAALEPKVVDFLAPDGAKGQVALIPLIDGSGRITMQIIRTGQFCDEYRTAPRARTGTAILGDLPSLIAHINRFKDADSAVFADTSREAPSITAVLNYHRHGAESPPRFGSHRSTYTFPMSEPWTAWTGVNGKEMSQGQFAEFIETNLIDVVEPSEAKDGATFFAQKTGMSFASCSKLLELSRGLSVNVGQKVVQTINLQSGERQIQFAEEHTDQGGAPLKVPGAFLIGIPVFRADDRYQLCVRLRYRKSGGALTWIMDLWRHEEVFDAAILQACQVVKSQTSLPLFVGTPE